MKDNFWKNYHQPFRRDFTIFDEYKYASEAPLDMAIVAFLSSKDPKITKALMQPWCEQTLHSEAFEVVDFDGDHFYVQERKVVPALVSKISEFVRKVQEGSFPPPPKSKAQATSCIATAEKGKDESQFIQEDIVRRINLLEILQEDFPEVNPPPEDCVGKS